MARFLVTGGAGFIGSSLAEHLVSQGESVVILDDFSTGKRENVADLGGSCKLIEGSVTDLDVCRLAVAGVDYVLHEAALPSVPRSIEDPVASNDVNIAGTLNILVASRDEGVKRFVFAASSSAYGDTEQLPKVETMQANPLSPYAITKYSGELYCEAFSRLFGLDTIALRYFNIFGPRQDPHGEAGVVAIFCDRLQSAEELTIFGDGEQTRDYVYVKDVVSANLLASEMVLKPGPNIDAVAFNVGTGVGTSVNRLADVLESIAEDCPGRVYREARVGELRHSTLDVSRFAERGWAARHTLKDGLRETFHFIANQKIGA